MTRPENMFPDPEIYSRAIKGFTIVENMHPEWIVNLFNKYGFEVMLQVDVEDERLGRMIYEDGGMYQLLHTLVHDVELLNNIIPNKLHELAFGTLEDDLELQSETWARIIKLFIMQGGIALGRLDDDNIPNGMNGALLLDWYEIEDDHLTPGDYQINKEEIVRRLGDTGMLALHALFHSMTVVDFHAFIASPPGAQEPQTMADALIDMSRLIAGFVQPKGYREMQSTDALLDSIHKQLEEEGSKPTASSPNLTSPDNLYLN